MKHTMFYRGQLRTFDVNLGMKIGHSVFILSSHETPRNKDDIIEFFMSSTLEDAIRNAILSDYFEKNGKIYVITGDGQVAYITPDPLPEQ